MSEINKVNSLSHTPVRDDAHAAKKNQNTTGDADNQATTGSQVDSDEQLLLSTVIQEVSANSEEFEAARQAHIDRLKAQIKQGTYEINALEIAEKIVNEEL